MNPLDAYFALSQSNRRWIYSLAGVIAALIAYADWKSEDVSLGFMYIVPVVLAAAILRSWQIAVLSVGCSILREWFSPLHQMPGSWLRVAVAAAGFTLVGYFVAELNRKRQLVAEHVREVERQAQLRLDAEKQLQVVIETSPLAILTLDGEGRVLLTNESARNLLRLDGHRLQGEEIQTYVPILRRFLKVSRSTTTLRTTVESRGQRADGESFLAHVWLSTFTSTAGPCLAAFIWDASENLRDREGTGLDTMMATSRIAVGAVSHEIRNLASAAAAAHKQLLTVSPISQEESFQTLGRIIAGLEKIAASGLVMAAHNARAVADLEMILDETRVVIDSSFQEVGATIHWRLADRLPLVQVDHHSLLQVFLNLARNSRGALRDARYRRLFVEAGVENDMVLVRFRDTGPGIAHPESLFKPFQPGAASTGLGLYISRAVLRSYGGDLNYEPGKDGACFAVQLWPAENVDEPGSSE